MNLWQILTISKNIEKCKCMSVVDNLIFFVFNSKYPSFQENLENWQFNKMSCLLFSIRERTNDAIRRGAPIYNKGNIVECERIYMNLRQEIISDCVKNKSASKRESKHDKNIQIIQEILENVTLLPSDKKNVKKSSSDQNAWALRRSLDKILDLLILQSSEKSLLLLVFTNFTLIHEIHCNFHDLHIFLSYPVCRSFDF